MGMIYPVEKITAVYFDGARTLCKTPRNDAKSRFENAGLLKSIYAKVEERLTPPEDPASIRSADRYLETIGFSQKSIGIFHAALKSVVTDYIAHMEACENLHGDPEYGDHLYLGFQINGKPALATDPAIIDMREAFTTNLSMQRKCNRRMTWTVETAFKERAANPS